MTDQEQKLIIGAYKDQADKWKKEKLSLEAGIDGLTNKLAILDVERSKVNFLKVFWFKYILRRPLQLDLRIAEAEMELKDLIMKHQRLLMNEPQAVLYDIALYGGTLFKVW